MRIEVKIGEVPIRNVVVRSCAEGRIYTVTIATPLDKRPLASLGLSITPPAGLSQFVELYRPSIGRAEFNPSRVTLTPESADEEIAIECGLFEIDWASWNVTLIGFRPTLFDEGYTVNSWERFEPGAAEYL